LHLGNAQLRHLWNWLRHHKKLWIYYLRILSKLHRLIAQLILLIFFQLFAEIFSLSHRSKSRIGLLERSLLDFIVYRGLLVHRRLDLRNLRLHIGGCILIFTSLFLGLWKILVSEKKAFVILQRRTILLVELRSCSFL